LAFRERHFGCAGNGYEVGEAVRQQVSFQQGNLFDQGFLPGTGVYDVIFCRNVLIYFDRPTQDRAVGVLERLLAPQGTLFVGPSETALLLGHAFTSSKIPLAFAFRRATKELPKPVTRGTARPRLSAVPRVNARTSARPKPPRGASLKPPRMPSKKPAAAATPRRSGHPPAELEQAARLADEGKLAVAAQICHSHVAAHGPSAPALHLLGVISDASGNATGAADYYRKALYLDPNHQEALFHLALLLDSRGDAAGAKAMRGRAERVARKSRK
jgi:chemotaxis protein methyltransferase WspC